MHLTTTHCSAEVPPAPSFTRTLKRHRSKGVSSDQGVDVCFEAIQRMISGEMISGEKKCGEATPTLPLGWAKTRPSLQGGNPV